MRATITSMRALRLGTIVAFLIFTQTGRADSLDTWTWRNPLPTGNTLSAIAFGNGQFVAVGDVGTIVTSVDGVKWVLRRTGTTNWLRDIVFVNGQFVAVGEVGTIVTSANRADWILRQSGTTDPLSGIGYGNGHFVAVGRSLNSQDGPGTIVVSSDGLNWVPQPSVDAFMFSAIAYGNGQFVASATTSTTPWFLVTSPDGVNWSLTGLGWFWVSQRGIAYANGQFVAEGSAFQDSSAIIVTSVDGTNWVKETLGTTNSLSTICYGNGEFMAIGNGEVLTSSDAVHWSAHPLAYAPCAPSALAYGNGQFVAVGDGGAIMTSAEGVTWLRRQTGLAGPFDLNEIAYGNGQFVAVGIRNATGLLNEIAILTSADRVNWIQPQLGVSSENRWLNGIAYGNGQFVAVGPGIATNGTSVESTILTSADGVNWIQRQSGCEYWLWDVAYGNSQFVAVGDAGTILTSVDGVSWVTRQSETGAPNTLIGIAYGNGQFVAVGGSWNDTGCPSGDCLPRSTIVTSADGVNWVERLAGIGYDLCGIAYGNGQFVASGSGTVLTSVDGVNWVQRLTGLDWEYDWHNNISYGNGQFVAIQKRGGILSSPDGVNWVQHHLGGTASASAYGNGYFMAVGPGGTILQSACIITLALTPNTSSGLLSLSLEGPTGLAYTVQSSADLISWQTVTNITSTQPSTIILDAGPAASGQVFYRAYFQ